MSKSTLQRSTLMIPLLIGIILLGLSLVVFGYTEGGVSYNNTLQQAMYYSNLSSGQTELHQFIDVGTQPQILEEGGVILDTAYIGIPSITDSYSLFQYQNFTGEITWKAVSLTLNNTFGLIGFREVVDLLSLSDGFVVDAHINISDNYAFINSSYLGLNVSADIALYNIQLSSIRITKNGYDCTDCVIYNYSGSTASFRVAGFGLYTAENESSTPVSIQVSRNVTILSSSLDLTGEMYNASYPVNVTLDIGNNGIIEFNHSDILNGTVNTTTNLTIALNALAPDCTCSGCSIANNVSCLVPVTVTSATQGSVILTHLNITQQIRNYTLSQFVNQTALDLDDYFFDENNDSLNYTVVFRAATDTATLLYCSLDSSLSCASGDTGTSDAGYSEAVFSSGIRINSSTNLTFISGDVLDISKGTFEAWVVPDWNGSTGARYVLLDMNATGAGNSMSIYKNESGYLVAEILDASVNSYKVTYNISSWLDHQKHHIVFSWNTNDMQLAVDGKVQDTLSSATMPTATSSLTYIGSSMNNTDHFNGTIDELKISNRVRTDYYNVSNLSYSINAENILTFIPDRYYNGSLVATYISDDGHARTFSNRFNLTILPDTLSPIVTLLTSSATIYNQNLTLSYNVSENIDIASCNMYHNLTHTFELNQSTVFTGFNQTASFAFIALPDLATFIWNVECVDIYGNNAFASENRTISIVYPIDAPATINSSYNSTVQNGVRLDWNDVTYATGYVIQTSSDLQIFTNLTTVSESNYTDTSANNVATRYYKIVAQKPGYANASTILLGKQNYTLKEKSSGTTKNWFGYIFNNTRIQKAKDLLYDIPNASAIVMYNSTLQITVTCNKATCPDICTATTCNFNLSAGQQYEVLMENNIGSMEYTYTGNVLDPVVVTLVKNTTSYGKNWISVPANTTLTTASTLLNNISTANSVSKWDAATQKSQGWISLFGGLGTNFNIEPRAGYEVSVTSNFNWTQR